MMAKAEMAVLVAVHMGQMAPVMAEQMVAMAKALIILVEKDKAPRQENLVNLLADCIPVAAAADN